MGWRGEMWRERIRNFAERLARIRVHLVNSTASAQFHPCSWNIDGTHFLVKSKNIQVSAGWSESYTENRKTAAFQSSDIRGSEEYFLRPDQFHQHPRASHPVDSFFCNCIYPQ